MTGTPRDADLKPAMAIDEAKRRARRGPLLLLARRLVSLTITFVSTITVARLVSPRDYGLANMSGVIVAFAMVFRDFGLTNAVLRKGTISQAEASLIFWFNVGMTLCLALLIAACAPLASRFYHEPVVFWVILASLVGFVLDGASLQHRSLMNRELRFGAMAMIDAAGLLAAFVVTLTLAFLRHDVWAIVIGNMTQSLCGSSLYVIVSGWRPSRPRRSAELASLLRFGANSSLFSISVFLSNNAAAIIIGHLLNSSSLGQFNRAQALFTLPNTNLIQPITQATMPLMTRLRGHPEEYRQAYLGLVRKLCAFLMPMSVALTFAAAPLVQALLGDKWRIAGAVLSAFAPALAAMGFAYSVSDLFITQDRSAELRTLGLFEMVLRVSAILIGVHFGLVATALGFTLSTIAVAFIRLFVAGRRGPVTAADQLRAARPGVPMACGAGIGCLLVRLAGLDAGVSHATAAAVLLTAGAGGALLAGLAVPASRRALAELGHAFGVATLLARLRGRKPSLS